MADEGRSAPSIGRRLGSSPLVRLALMQGRRSFNRLHLSCRRQFSAGVQANGTSPPLRWPSGLCSSSESRALSSLTCSLTTATIGALALTVGQLCFALVTNTTTGLNLLWLAIVFNAVSLAFNSVAVNPSLAECATPESMGSVIGFGGMSANAARIFGPICWGSLYRGAWRHTYYVSSIVGLLSAGSFALAALYSQLAVAALWLRINAQKLLSRDAERHAAVERLMLDLEYVLTTRGYSPEIEETELLCREVLDCAFPDLSEDAVPADQAELLKEQLSLLYMQKGDGSVLQGGGSVLQSVGTT